MLAKSSTAICVLPILAMCWVGSTRAQGYYKDVFLDGGIALGFHEILAVKNLSLTWEYIHTADAARQTSVIVGSAEDANGVLLYPDGSPRFRLFYSFGGSSAIHGSSLGDEGIQRIREFYFNGGSYSGSCAGCALFAAGKDGAVFPWCYGLWPGTVHQMDSDKLYTDQVVPLHSPLLLYRQFGNDFRIDSVLFWGGNYPILDGSADPRIEVLANFDAPGLVIHGQPSCWAFKANPHSGRGVVTGSHPEECSSRERVEYTEAIYLYALDGVGEKTLKGDLAIGTPRRMDRYSWDHDPLHARIGDRQYHHFRVHVPADGGVLTVVLQGEEGFDFHLYVRNNDFAYDGNADFTMSGAGSAKTIVVPSVRAGEWYVGVECASTVESEPQEEFVAYSGNLKTLNGLAYTITADWMPRSGIPTELVLLQNYPNPFNAGTRIVFGLPAEAEVSVCLYDLGGRRVEEILQGRVPAGYHAVDWVPGDLASGVYVLRVQSGGVIRRQRCLLLR